MATMLKFIDFIIDNKIITRIYLPIMFPSGFYRGFNSIDYYDYKDGKKNNNELYINKFSRGLYFGFNYITFYGPIAIYNFFGRLEIELTNKNPYKYEEYYKELGYITLKPKNKKKIN